MIYLAIYLSGVAFFISQAAMYCGLSRKRIVGAVIWPMAIISLPFLYGAYKQSIDEIGRGPDWEPRIKSIAWGRIATVNTTRDMLWGVGA